MKKFMVGVLVLVMLFSIVGCASDTMARNTAGGIGGGALAGAAIGAILGAIVGDPATGAALGAASGAAIGGSTGAAIGYETKSRRAAGTLVPPPPQNVVRRYEPWFDRGLWRCHNDADQVLWWDENVEGWR